MPRQLLLQPLDISCTSTDCENGLHCFRQKRRLNGHTVAGKCRTCGAELVDWTRVHQRGIGDAKHTFEQLRREHFRHHYWHCAIDQRAINHARRMGRRRLFANIRKRLQSAIGSAHHPRQGRQTPLEGNLIYYAQHATASCCRPCAEYWHGIPNDRALNEEELDYLCYLAELYIIERVADLAESGRPVPPIRRCEPV